MTLIPDEWKEIILSHHPDLPCFQEDVIVLFNRRICVGCLLAYPTAFLIILLFHPIGPMSIFLSLYFAGLSQFRRVIHDNPLFGQYCRVLAGIAFGFGIGGFYWATSTGQELLAGLLVIGAGIYFVIKFYNIKERFYQHVKNIT